MKEKFLLFLALLMLACTVSCGRKPKLEPQKTSEEVSSLTDAQVAKIARDIWYSGLVHFSKARDLERKSESEKQFYVEKYESALFKVETHLSKQYEVKDVARIMAQIYQLAITTMFEKE